MASATDKIGINEVSTGSTPVPEIIRHGAFRFPPGLRFNLLFYTGRSFFDRRNPILLFEYLKEKFGRAAHYRLLWHHVVVLNDPSDIREVLIDKARFFTKERTQKRMKMLLGEGLITSDGEIHRRHRAIAAPAFHRQRIQAYANTIVEHADAMQREWHSSQSFDIAAAMMRLALQITARTLFDTEVTPEIETINDESNAVMDIYNDLMQTPQAELLFRWRIPLPVLQRFRRSRQRLDTVVSSMITRRQAESAMAQREGRPIGSDLLSMLIAAHDEIPEGDTPEAASSAPKTLNSEELRDEVVTIFLAGYETVANALAWTWFLLARNPIAEAKLFTEITSVLSGRLPTLTDLPQMPYTEAVIAESMRLYPPAWAMGRQATADVEIGPYRFPKGSYLFFSQYIVQRDSKFFPDPLAFQPERFLGEGKADRPRFAYFPFGGGSRQCIGESFAWMEAVLVLVTIAQHWRFTLVPSQKIELQPKITLRPKFGIHTIAHQRSSCIAKAPACP